MSLLQRVTEDEVRVPHVNRMVRYLVGALAILICAVLLLFRTSGALGYSTTLLVVTSLSAAIGVACFSWVSIIRLNRKTGTISRRWGFFLPGSSADETVRPKAVRLLMDNDRDDSNILDHHAIVLVHEKGELLLRRTWCLDTARCLSEELAAFLGLARYEDLLPARAAWRHRLAPAHAKAHRPKATPKRRYTPPRSH